MREWWDLCNFALLVFLFMNLKNYEVEGDLLNSKCNDNDCSANHKTDGPNGNISTAVEGSVSYEPFQCCKWKLNGGTSDEVFLLSFNYFELRSSENCSLDYVTIEDGRTSGEHSLTFCGADFVKNIYTSGPYARVTFVAGENDTDASVVGPPGFDLKYSRLSNATKYDTLKRPNLKFSTNSQKVNEHSTFDIICKFDGNYVFKSIEISLGGSKVLFWMHFNTTSKPKLMHRVFRGKMPNYNYRVETKYLKLSLRASTILSGNASCRINLTYPRDIYDFSGNDVSIRGFLMIIVHQITMEVKDIRINPIFPAIGEKVTVTCHINRGMPSTESLQALGCLGCFEPSLDENILETTDVIVSWTWKVNLSHHRCILGCQLGKQVASTRLLVLHAPKSVSLPPLNTMNMNDNFECSAQGHPLPTTVYTVHRTDGTKLLYRASSNQSTKLNRYISDDKLDFTLSCKADNFVGSRNKEVKMTLYRKKVDVTLILPKNTPKITSTSVMQCFPKKHHINLISISVIFANGDNVTWKNGDISHPSYTQDGKFDRKNQSLTFIFLPKAHMNGRIFCQIQLKDGAGTDKRRLTVYWEQRVQRIYIIVNNTERTHVTEGDYVTFTCEFDFGNPNVRKRPSLKNLQFETRPCMDANVTKNGVTLNNVSRSMRVNWTHDQHKVICSSESITHYRVLIVHSKPRIVFITTGTVSPGGFIKCSAHGNPIPKVSLVDSNKDAKWKKFEGKGTSTLKVYKNAVAKNYKVLCTATNYLGSVEKEQMISVGLSRVSWVTIVLAITALPVIVFIILGILYIRRMFCLTVDDTSTDTEETDTLGLTYSFEEAAFYHPFDVRDRLLSNVFRISELKTSLRQAPRQDCQDNVALSVGASNAQTVPQSQKQKTEPTEKPKYTDTFVVKKCA